MTNESKCPVIGGNLSHTKASAISNDDWWPNQLNLKILHQNSSLSNPMDKDFSYAKEFESLNLNELKKDIEELMTTSKDWWPADYGHYGPLFIRMAWHSAGTYRIGDGRGGAGAGTLRFAPLNSWPDNANLDKARRLLWPIKQKYGQKISWADLMIFTGNCALESMGFKTFGFGGGREDLWEPEGDIYWGPETEWLGDKRYSGERNLANPLGAVQMGLIYVNPEGPNGNPDPLASAKDIRETFARMAMNDEETVALIAGGHTFGKCHGASDASKYVGPEPEGATIEEQGLGWKNSFNSGKGVDTITSGLEGAWTTSPTKWDNNYFENLFNYEWELTKGSGGANQWTPKNEVAKNTVPDAHDSSKTHAPMMLTSDIALKEDPIYGKISKRFYENSDEFALAFSKAWYKLTHRDMGPKARYLGSLVPKTDELWQDPMPKINYKLIDEKDVESLKKDLLNSSLSISDLVFTAWASASTFRGTDKRGGANGARIRLSPQKDWEVNDPEKLNKNLEALKEIKKSFNDNQSDGKQVSLSDLIVLGGVTAIEEASKNTGVKIKVPFKAGRVDATESETDIESFSVLEPKADAFRNYVSYEESSNSEAWLLEKAFLLNLTAPEMTVLLGGMRVLNTNTNQSKLGVLTENKDMLTNDFFINLLDLNLKWEKSKRCEHFFEGKDLTTKEVKWTASAVDLVFGANSQLRAISEVYACQDSKEKFVRDFVCAWNKVMNLDMF